MLFEKYPIDYLINIGSAGGLDLKQNVGDVVISNAITYHDVDVTAFNYEYGQMAGQPQQFKPSTSLMNICQQVLTTMNQTVHIGLIVSGDTFVSKQSHVDTIYTISLRQFVLKWKPLLLLKSVQFTTLHLSLFVH